LSMGKCSSGPGRVFFSSNIVAQHIGESLSSLLSVNRQAAIAGRVEMKRRPKIISYV